MINLPFASSLRCGPKNKQYLTDFESSLSLSPTPVYCFYKRGFNSFAYSAEYHHCGTATCSSAGKGRRYGPADKSCLIVWAAVPLLNHTAGPCEACESNWPHVVISLCCYFWDLHKHTQVQRRHCRDLGYTNLVSVQIPETHSVLYWWRFHFCV